MDSNERWKSINGFDGVYMVSDLGNVKSVDRYIPHQGGARLQKGKALKGHKLWNGYLQVCLRNNGDKKLALIHRLVAEAFLPPPPREDMCIDHINMVKDDNRAENLEWVTHKENTARAWANGACDETLKKRSRRVVNDVSGITYPSISVASLETGIPYATLNRWVHKNIRGWAFA